MTDLDAVLWDLDGTLIDSEPYWMAAERRLVDEFGIPWTEEDALALVGVDLWDGARTFIAKGVPMSADAIVERLTGEVLVDLAARVPYRPGARELLVALRAAGVPTALVTMSTRAVADLVVSSLERDLGITPFDATVAGDEVERGKPDADPYLRGLAALGVEADRAVAIEDSIPGVNAALAAGLTTIGVPHAVDVSTIHGVVHWPTLADRMPADLAAAVRA